MKDSSGTGIARGTTELQQDGLKEIYDAQKVAEQMEMGQVAAEVGFTAAGDIARSMTRDYERAQMAKEAAENALMKETDPDRIAALTQTIAQADRTMSTNQAQYDLWKDGGTAKTITHAVAGALSAGLGGGSSLDGALGAAAAELARPLTADETKLVKSLVSFGIGAAIGGSSGASTGLAGEVYNRQLHESEKAAIERVIAEGGDREAVQAVACALVQCWSGVDGAGVMTQVLQEQTAATIANLSPAEYQKIVTQLQGAAPDEFQYLTGDRLDDWAIDNDLNGKLKWLGNTVLDLTPGIGDAKGYYEAESLSDYYWATIGLIPLGGDVAKGAAKGAKESAEEIASAAGKGQIHHICTDKNCISAASGGPWTPEFQRMFDGAGMSLQDEANKVLVLGHKGPHPKEYHETVMRRLEDATDGIPRNTPAYEQALRSELGEIRKEINMPGTDMNSWVTGRGR